MTGTELVDNTKPMFPASARRQRVWKVDPGFTVRAKRSPTLTGGQPDIFGYDAFWGMTPAVLEPGCRCTPLSESVRADLAQMLPHLVSSAL